MNYGTYKYVTDENRIIRFYVLCRDLGYDNDKIRRSWNIQFNTDKQSIARYDFFDECFYEHKKYDY